MDSPNFLKIPSLILFACLASSHLVSAQILRGHVRDRSTNEPLPAATVQIAGTYQGTITNNEGMYAITVENLPADIVVRYIGFRTDTLTAHTLTPLEFRLEPITLTVGQMVVTEDDPAVAIMQQVIERKQVWRQKLSTFEAQAYTRYTFSNDSGIVAITESAATAWWDQDRGLTEQITGSRSTGNMPFEDALPAASTMLNLYDDDVQISGHRLIGVTHPDALDRYVFTLEGTRSVDDQLVYDIVVESKHSFISGFEGSISVLDGDFAMIEARLRPGEAFIFPLPIQQYETTYLQQFSNYGGEIWLPIDLRSATTVKISFGPLLRLPMIGINTVSRFTDYQLNIELADSLFTEDTFRLNVDSSAVSSGESFKREGAIVPLTPKETVAYASIDSTDSFREAYKPQGSLGRTINRLDEFENRRRRLRRQSSSLIPNLGVRPHLWYNRVDGFFGGLRLENDFSDWVTVKGYAGINTGQTGPSKYQYQGIIRVGQSWFLEVGYRAENLTTYRSNTKSRFVNSMTMLFGQDDYFDYYRREGILLSGGYRFDQWPNATITGTYLHETHSQIQGNISYDLLGKSAIQRPNGEIIEGDLRTFTVAIRAGRDELLEFGPSRYFESSMEVSMPSSEFVFRRYALRAGGRVATLLRRRFLPATLDFGISAGLSSDGGRTLPPQRSFIVEGGTSIYHWSGSLYTLKGLPYQGTGMVFGHWEHNFRTLLFEVLGLRWIADRGYNILMFGGHAFVHSAEAQPKQWIQHHELGLSLSGLFGLMRVDLAYRIEENKFYPAISAARIF